MMQGQSTLEAAGYNYNPFTANDIWGAPAQVSLTPELRKELPVGADDSALPQFAQPHLRNGEPVPGSDNSAAFRQRNYERERAQSTNSMYFAAFAAIVAAALYFRLPE